MCQEVETPIDGSIKWCTWTPLQGSGSTSLGGLNDREYSCTNYRSLVGSHHGVDMDHDPKSIWHRRKLTWQVVPLLLVPCRARLYGLVLCHRSPDEPTHIARGVWVDRSHDHIARGTNGHYQPSYPLIIFVGINTNSLSRRERERALLGPFF